jgi:lactoylglutathione lyase
MVRIEHVALWTCDLGRLADFYARYFGAAVGPRYQNPARGFESCFLSFAGGARLELMASTTLKPVHYAPGAERMGLTHLAIALGPEARVDELTGVLAAAGCTVVQGPRRTGDGYYESVVLDPDGNRIELAADATPAPT